LELPHREVVEHLLAHDVQHELGVEIFDLQQQNNPIFLHNI
jgi:hypothetical protein